MKQIFSLWMIVLMLFASVGTGKAQIYSLQIMTSDQFTSGGTDVWSFERHDVVAGTYSAFTLCDESSIAVNFFDQFIVERFNLYPIFNRPASGTQYETKRKAWYADPNEYLYVAQEYPAGTTVGSNLVYGENYPDTLMGYEVYSMSSGKNSAITFTVPANGYYRADMKVIRMDLWSAIGPMKVFQFFRYGGEGAAYPMGQEFSYGITKNTDTWAAGNEDVYNEHLMKIPENPTVNSNNGKPFRGLPTGSTAGYFYFYAKEGDKISFETDARSTGNSENTPRGGYARTKWSKLIVTAADETTAKADAKYVNPYINDEELLNDLSDMLDISEDVINNHPEYSQSSRNALEALFVAIGQRFDDGAIRSMEIPSLIAQLQHAIDLCRASQGGLKVRYTFENVDNNIVPDLSGQGNNGTLLNNASIVSLGKYKVMDLGTANGYLNMGAAIGSVVSGMNDYTISTYYRIDPAAPFSGNGFMLFAFSTQEANASNVGEYIYFRMPNQGYNISAAGWSNASNLEVAAAPEKGVWKHVVLQQKGTTCTIYVNGVEVKSGEMPAPLTKFTKSTPYNWIGRPPFSGDSYLKQTLVYDFRLYNYAMPVDSISKWATLVTDLEDATNHSSDGDYTELNALIASYTTIANTASIGEAAGQYTLAAKEEFLDAINVARTISEEQNSSQLKINAEVVLLKAAYQKFLGTVNVETNTLSEGLYYITLTDSLYLTNPGTAALANGQNLLISNNGLSKTKITTDFSQLFTIAKVTSLETPRYSIFSALNEEDVYRHLTENAVFQSSWGNPGGGTTSSDDNWRTFNILFNGAAYAIQNAGQSANKGYWQYDATNMKLAVSSTNPSFVFKFITYDGTGISKVYDNGTQIYPGSKSIEISTENPVNVTVYTITGVPVFKTVVSGSQSIPVQSGLYIVKASGEFTTVKKVFVK